MTDASPARASIRRAVAADAEAARACVRAAYAHYTERMGKPPGPMLADYAQMIASHTVHVAEIEDRVVGVLVVMETSAGVLLDNVAVLPGQQGTGLGRRLIDLAEQTARDLGHDAISLYTHDTMVENQRLYHALGYQVTHRATESGYSRVYMRKRV